MRVRESNLLRDWVARSSQRSLSKIKTFGITLSLKLLKDKHRSEKNKKTKGLVAATEKINGHASTHVRALPPEDVRRARQKSTDECNQKGKKNWAIQALSPNNNFGIFSCTSPKKIGPLFFFFCVHHDP